MKVTVEVPIEAFQGVDLTQQSLCLTVSSRTGDDFSIYIELTLSSGETIVIRRRDLQNAIKAVGCA